MALFALNDVKVALGLRVLASSAEVSEMELRMGTRFPTGYRDFMTTLGEGNLGSDCICVYPPWEINNKTQAEWRERVSDYWNWDRSAKVLNKEKALECVLIGSSCDGEIVFHPSEPDRLYILSQDSPQIHRVGPGLFAALDQLLGSRISDGLSETVEFVQSNSTRKLTYSECKDALVTALKRDALLHDASRFGELGDGFDDLENRVPRDLGTKSENLMLALNFWSTWLHASEHGWNFQEPLNTRDWPNFARRIADDLESDREITDPFLVKQFGQGARFSYLLVIVIVSIILLWIAFAR